MPIKKNGTPPQVPADEPQPPISPVPAEARPPCPPADAVRAIRAGFGQPLTKYDLSIQRQISRAGLYQAALQSQGVMVHNSQSFEQYLIGVRKAAEEGLKFINE